MKSADASHAWSSQALFSKAQLFAMQMAEYSHQDSNFGLFSTFVLECVARSAVATVSPTLLADPKDRNNILFALGHSTTSNHAPRSLAIADVLRTAKQLFPEFTKEHHDFCGLHLNRRNEELHTGTLAFRPIEDGGWLPWFYATCDVLAQRAGKSVDALFTPPLSEEAATFISTLGDRSADEMKKLISDQRSAWEAKDEETRRDLTEQAKLLSTRDQGHRVACPSCGSVALVRGEAVGQSRVRIEEGSVIVEQDMQPSSFACKACGLRVTGYSKLSASGLGSLFKSTKVHHPVEYFGSEYDRWSEYEEDNNEPF